MSCPTPGNHGPAADSIKCNIVRTIRTLRKDHLNVFNTIQAHFLAFGSANPLFSTTSSLFSAKQG
jgi:hypothetical protein